MIGLLVAAVLAQPYPANPTCRQGKSPDGGTAWTVEVVTGPSLPAQVYVLDAGVLNVNPSTDVGAGSTTANTLRVVLPLDQTSIPTNPSSWNGAVIATGAGNSSNGTLRVVVATNQPTLATSLPDGGTQATEVTQQAIVANQTNGQEVVRVSNLPRTLGGAVKTDSSGAVQPVTVVSQILPPGAAQEAGGNLAAILATLLSVQQLSLPTVFGPPPINPFLLRCNAVRRINCQP